MSNTGQKDRAYPRSEEAKGYFLVTGCGGSGGAGCYQQIGAVRAVGGFRIPKFVVHIRRIFILNAFNGLHPFTDGGDDGMGCRIAVDPIRWYMAFSADGILTDKEIIAQDISFYNEGYPVEIEVDGKRLPQPIDDNWEGKIYVHLYWGDDTAVNLSGSNITLTMAKQDFDVKI